MTKLAIIVALILSALAVTTYKIYDGLVARPKRESAAAASAGKELVEKPKASLLSSSSAKSAEAEDVPVVHLERFQFFEDMRRFGYRGPARCRTGSGWYVVGEMSRYGLVEAIRVPDLSTPYAVIRCRQAKRVVFVVAQEGAEYASGESEAVKLDEKPATL